jgi:hypothetical protein
VKLNDREALVFHHDNQHSVLRKIVVTTVTGALSFPLTNLLFSSPTAQLTMAAGVGGLILMIQFLIDFERRLAAVEGRQLAQVAEIRQAVQQGFTKVNAATKLFSAVETAGLKTDNITRLVEKAVAIGPHAPPLLTTFIQTEMERLAQFLHELGDQEATYDGEDRDWLLALTRSAKTSIDAISLPAVDAGGQVFQGGFWGSDLGHRYLSAQREAVHHKVCVRRIFIIERPSMADDPGFHLMCSSQATLGIDVRVLYPSDMPSSMKSYLYDFVLFDNVLSYEVTPAAHVEDGANPLILHTRLILRTGKLEERIERYRELWEAATPYVAPGGEEMAVHPDDGRSASRRR